MTPTQKKLFGTDGVRGVAGELLTAELALALGRAAAAGCDATRPQVLIVRDTRESGPMLESALAAGVCRGGRRRAARRSAADARRLDPGPPPRARPRGRDLRLAQPVARQRDQVLRSRRSQARRRGGGGGSRRGWPTATPAGAAGSRSAALARSRGRSTTTCASSSTPSRSTCRGPASCSTARTAPRTGRRRRSSARLGAEVELIGDEPDGRNINEGCGSTAPGGGRVRGGRWRGDDRLRLRRGRRPGHRRRRARRGARRRRADRAAWPRTCGRPAGSTASRSR